MTEPSPPNSEIRMDNNADRGDCDGAAANAEGVGAPLNIHPFYREVETDQEAVFGLQYILRQIEATNTYRPHIGQTRCAASSLRRAIARLSGDQIDEARPIAPAPPSPNSESLHDQ